MVSGGDDLGTATLELRADLDRLKADLRSAEGLAQKRMDAFAKKARAAGFALAGVGAVFTGIGVAGVKTFASFEQSMANVQAVSGATAYEFEALSDVAKEMGATTVFTANQAADALGFMAMAGIDAANSIEALPSVLNLAAAGQLELAESADIVTNIMAGFGIQAQNVERATDVLVTGFTSANTNLLQLGEAFTYVGPVAKAAGLAFEETTAALALLGNAGFQGSLAGTSLRAAITKLLSPTSEGVDIIDRLGVQVLNAAGDMIPFVEIVAQLERGGLSAADAMTLFGLRAGPGMLALISQGSDALAELTTQMELSGGAAQRIADRQLDTFQGQMTLMRSAVEALLLSIGSRLVPVLEPLIAAVTTIVQRFAEWSETMPGLSSAVVITAVALGALALVAGVALIGAGLLAGAMGTLGITMIGVTGAATAMWVAITGPVGLIVLGILGIAAAGAYLYNRFDGVRIVVDALWQAIQDFARDSVAALEPLIELLGGIVGLFSGLGSLLQIPQTIDVEVEPVAAPDLGLFGQVEQATAEQSERALLEASASIAAVPDGMQKAVSGLTTGRTRWRNIRLENAQADAAGRIIEAIEDQTGDLSEALSAVGAAPDGGVDAERFRWSDYLTGLSGPSGWTCSSGPNGSTRSAGSNTYPVSRGCRLFPT